jgi:signal peptidase II
MTPKLRWFLITALVAIPLDRLSKHWIDATVPLGDRRAVIEGFFYLTHVRNPGIAFGMLDDVPDPWRTLGFVAVSIVAAVVIASFLARLAPGERFGSLALGLVFGGAVGNFVDRMWLGGVIDFLHFRLWAGYSWPDFNFADTCIVLGVAMLVFELLVAEGRADEATASSTGESG